MEEPTGLYKWLKVVRKWIDQVRSIKYSPLKEGTPKQ